MLQLYYNEKGIWSIGFLTSDAQSYYFGSELGIADIESEVWAFGGSSELSFFGFEAYETLDNLLATLAVLVVDTKCYDEYRASAGDNFVWKMPP